MVCRVNRSTNGADSRGQHLTGALEYIKLHKTYWAGEETVTFYQRILNF